MFSNSSLKFSIFLLTIFTVNTAFAEVYPARRITILANGRTIANISREIGEKTGVTIFVSENLKEIQVDGDYRAIAPEEFFLRALKKKNIVLEWNNNMLYVRSFGSKTDRSFLEHVQSKERDLNLTRQHVNKLNKDIDPVSGLPIKELQQRYEKAIKAGKAKYEDQGIDPVSGLPIKELQQRYEKSIKEGKDKYEARGVDPISGLPLM